MKEGVKKKTISMEEELYQKALSRAKDLGYESFSSYLQFLIAADFSLKPDHVRSAKKGLYLEQPLPEVAMVRESDKVEETK